jgi:lipopolysaccharide export system permease protein
MVPLGYCLAGLILFLITADLFANLSQYQRWKMHGNDIAEYYFFNLPTMLVFVLPISLLLALLYSLTNHARHNEITAMRAAGISLWRLCLPYFAVGLAATALLYIMNEYWAPGATDAAEALKTRRIQKTLPPENKITPFTFENEHGKRNWIAESFDTKTGEIVSPKVVWSLGNGSGRWLWASRAAWTNSQWVFYEVDMFDDDPGKNPYLVPLLRTNALAMPAFNETPGEINNYLKLSEAFSSLPTRGTKRSDIPIKKVRQYLRFNPDPKPSIANRLYTDLYGRLATPWTCVVVVLIAIPFGAGQGRRNVFVGVASSITICVIYFVLQQLGLMFGNMGVVSPWLAAWLPNLVFAAAGIWMSTRVR